MKLTMEEDKKHKIARLEALLFQYGEPITVKKISSILDESEATAEHLLEDYKEKLADDIRGLAILKKDGKVQLATKPELSDITEKLAKEEFREELTPAVLEVLTIISYLGPITKMDIDFIRGVNSSYAVRNLLMRGLVERERKGRTYEYKVSFDFLRHMGLERVEDLPEYEEYHDILDEYELSS